MSDKVWLVNEELVKEARNFIEQAISVSNEKLAVVYHGDGDGCCSAYFAGKFLKRLGAEQISYRWVSTADFDFKCLEKPMLKNKPNLAIFLDLPIYTRADFLRTLRRKSKIFIYDHHQPGKFAGSNLPDRTKFLYINPVIHQDGSTPATTFAWQLNGENDLLAKEILFMGLYTESWAKGAPFFQDMSQEHKNKLKEVARVIHSSFLVQDMNSVHYALNFLFSLDRPIIEEDLEQNRGYQILKGIYRLVQNEKEWLMHFIMQDMKKMPQPKYVLKRINSRLRLCGIIASELRWRYPELVVGVWQKWKDLYYCELRKGRECSVNLVELIEEIKKDVKLKTGGGHPEAAAFTANEYHFKKAVEKIKELMKEYVRKKRESKEKENIESEQ